MNDGNTKRYTERQTAMYEQMSLVDAAMWCAKHAVPVAIHNEYLVIGEESNGVYTVSRMESGKRIARFMSLDRVHTFVRAAGYETVQGWVVC